MEKYIYKIKLEGDSGFVNEFNHASELFEKSQDKLLSNEERERYWRLHLEQKARIELGLY